MSLNSTPSGERIHIGFFGRRNVGKSSLMNAVTSQDIAVVSEIQGTTTDPVYKSMELLPLGAAMIIDTAGIDDEGELGEKRIKKTVQVLNKTDIAVLVVDSLAGITAYDTDLIKLFEQKNISYIIAYNKCELTHVRKKTLANELYVSAATGEGVDSLKERITHLAPKGDESKQLVSDLLKPTDLVVLVTPIDSAAPKGRLILPQQQAIRNIIDAGAAAIVTKESELASTLNSLGRAPTIVITDSQVFKMVSEIVPADIPLTSFSILMARYKGFLETAVKGISIVDQLSDGDKILISEGCTHHRQCDDIGTVKIPKWLRAYTNADLTIETSTGTEFPDELTSYKLIIHCGGCMLGEREMQYRMKCAIEQGIAFTNYGVAIGYMQGILHRSLSLFPHLQQLL